MKLVTIILSLCIGIFGASAVFALCEAIDSAGLNPFETPAAVAVPSSALTTDRADMGSQP